MKTPPPRKLENWLVEAFRPGESLLKLKGDLPTGGFLCTSPIVAHSDGVLQTKGNHRYTLGKPGVPKTETHPTFGDVLAYINKLPAINDTV